jgi:two-component system nitrogen regulation sensor histidine kinase NtrY
MWKLEQRARRIAGRAVAGSQSLAGRIQRFAEERIGRGGFEDLLGGRRGLYLGMTVVVLALASALATYLILTGLTGIRPTHDVVITVLLVNFALLLALMAVVAWELWRLYLARKRNYAGARLHVRIVTLFSVIAVLPAILLAVFASSSLNRALDRLFSKGTEKIIATSYSVAQAYVQEHGQVIRSDIVAMANDLDGLAPLFEAQPKQFQSELFSQTMLRNLPMAHLIDGSGKLLVSAPVPNAPRYAPPAAELLRDAASGEVVIVPPGTTNRVGAIKRLEKLPNAYLYVARSVSGRVLDQLRATQRSINDFKELERRRQGTQIGLGMMYATVALTLLLSSVWMGLWLANGLVAPIRRLITASEEVSRGRLDVRVPEKLAEGDMRSLSTMFNRMTGELKRQRDQLVSANSQLVERRRFMEAVLSGVTAGVIGLEADGNITIVNPSALRLLGRDEADLLQRPLALAVPEFAEMLDLAGKDHRAKERLSGEIMLSVGQSQRTFAVQLTREGSLTQDEGLVVTFDDITDLVAAQRNSAWADVARRIAHEIKNPLTPIQLSAERLKRKYGAAITEDRDVFDRCIETIVRQVGDIGRMVDEFSSFARMPKPEMDRHDIRAIVREAVFLFQVSHPDIDFVVQLPDQPLPMLVDRRLLTQALTNLVKNATEGIAAVRERPEPEPGYRGRIETSVEAGEGSVTISVVDNGCGLPIKDRNRLTEPYVTTRAKGTGIGLAVVLKVTEQHGGQLRLEDAPLTGGRQHGAAVRMTLPVHDDAAENEAERLAAVARALAGNDPMGRADAAPPRLKAGE